jgi:shikimate kinase
VRNKLADLAVDAEVGRLIAYRTVWLQATPDEHMSRVLAQGDYRPMAGNTEAMDDLRRILAGRAPFYAKADIVVSTASKTLDQSFAALRSALGSMVEGQAAAAD